MICVQLFTPEAKAVGSRGTPLFFANRLCGRAPWIEDDASGRIEIGMCSTDRFRPWPTLFTQHSTRILGAVPQRDIIPGNSR